MPQDECQAGDAMSFGKVSQPVVTSAGTPWVSGLAPSGRVVASAAKVPVLHDSPLVAWQPAVGATTLRDRAVAALLPVEGHVGTRGPGNVDRAAPRHEGRRHLVVPHPGRQSRSPTGAQAMSWSAPVRLTDHRRPLPHRHVEPGSSRVGTREPRPRRRPPLRARAGGCGRRGHAGPLSRARPGGRDEARSDAGLGGGSGRRGGRPQAGARIGPARRRARRGVRRCGG